MENREEQPDQETRGTEDGRQGGEEPLHIIVEVSMDDEPEQQGEEESEQQGEEELQAEEEAGEQETERTEQETERTVESEERPPTPRTTRAGRESRKPRSFGEEVQVQLSPKERSKRKSRAKY